MILTLSSFVLLFLYAALACEHWKQKQKEYMKIAQDDFDIKLQELLLKRNLEK